MSLFSRIFWVYAFERAVKAVAQSGLASIGANSLGIMAVDWKTIGSIAALSGVASVLMSLNSFSGPGITGDVVPVLPAVVSVAPVSFPALVPLTVPTVADLTAAPVSILPAGFTLTSAPVPVGA